MSQLVNQEPLIWDDVDKVLREGKSTEFLSDDVLPKIARTAIEQEVNDQNTTRLRLEFRADGQARIHTTQHVGIVSLPDGPTIEIRPKAADTNLVTLLRYSQGIDTKTVEEETSLTAGRSFIEALAALYNAELESTLSRGLHQDYLRSSETVTHLRGRLNVQRQLQRQGPKPLKFECTFDELTSDTLINRSVLYATTILRQLVRDRSLSQGLERHQQRLRRRVELVSVRPIETENEEITRLADHYTDLFRLTKLVLRSVHIEQLRTGSRSSFALLMDMNEIFESVVERAIKETFAERPGWSVEDQAHSTGDLVQGGNRDIAIIPDVLVKNQHGSPVLVGDAKWKLDEPDRESREPSNEDIYQLVSYELAHNVPGVIFYPQQDMPIASEFTVTDLHPLRLVEIPISAPIDPSRSYAEEVVDAVKAGVDGLVSA